MIQDDLLRLARRLWGPNFASEFRALLLDYRVERIEDLTDMEAEEVRIDMLWELPREVDFE